MTDCLRLGPSFSISDELLLVEEEDEDEEELLLDEEELVFPEKAEAMEASVFVPAMPSGESPLEALESGYSGLCFAAVVTGDGAIVKTKG